MSFFSIFVKHLSTEFSLECLLSLIEFVQFQQMLDEHIHAEQLRADHEQHRERSLSRHSSNLSSTTTHSHSHSVGTLRGAHVANVNGSGGGIVSHIFSSARSQMCRAASESMDESLANHAPDIISDDECHEMKRRRFLYQKMRFPASVPRSKIVFHDMADVDGGSLGDSECALAAAADVSHSEFVRRSKLKAFTLYRKYVVGGCGLEINVGWSIRKQLLSVMGHSNKVVLDLSLVDAWHISLYGLIKLFDQCCNQMLVLLKDSFDRFKQTKQFDKLHEGLFSQQPRSTDLLM